MSKEFVDDSETSIGIMTLAQELKVHREYMNGVITREQYLSAGSGNIVVSVPAPHVPAEGHPPKG